MNSDWLAWSNPIAIWWGFLLTVSALNIALWLMLYCAFQKQATGRACFRIEPMLLLCAAYVFGCAFRSVLPRADVARICLFDTWLSSVLVGRSVATVAEVCFAIQWAIVLRQLARSTKSDLVQSISSVVVPLIILAECSSWYAVSTTSYLGNTVENSIWAATFLLIMIALLRLASEFRGLARFGFGAAVVGIAGYVAFLITIDVPMYFSRWQVDIVSGKQLLGLGSGLHDLATRWVVTREFADWKDEIAWMSLYFSVGVWSSLSLCSLGLVKSQLQQYRVSSRTLSARQFQVAP